MATLKAPQGCCQGGSQVRGFARLAQVGDPGSQLCTTAHLLDLSSRAVRIRGQHGLSTWHYRVMARWQVANPVILEQKADPYLSYVTIQMIIVCL